MQLSIDNAGEVSLDLGLGPAGGTRWSEDSGAGVSRTKFPGAEAGECFGVAVASPTAVPRIMIPLGARPAWVDMKLLQAQFGTFK